MEETSSASTYTGQQGVGRKATHITTSVDHPHLVRLDAESIRRFLRQYDAYCKELTARASQLLADGTVTTEATRPISMKLCVDSDQLESAVDLGLFDGIDKLEDLTEDGLRTFLKTKSEESDTTLTAADVDSLVDSFIRMDMSIKSAKSRMEIVFMEYMSMLRMNGLKWVTKKNPKVSIEHILSFIKPPQLKVRLQSDLEFSKTELRTDFKGFMKHAMDLSQAFEKLDNGPPSGRKASKDGKKGNTNYGGTREDSKPDKTKSAKTKTDKNKEALPPYACPLPSCKGKELFHWMDNCPDSTEAQVKAKKKQLAEERSRDGPSRSTRSQTQGDAASSSSRAIGRLTKTDKDKSSGYKNSPSCAMTVSDCNASFQTKGRCDDGSDESIVSPTLAEKAVIKGIGKIKAIPTVRVQIALTKTDTEDTFTFSRQWNVPCTVLHLSLGRLALNNISFLVADDELTCEDLLIGEPVLQHLRVDTRTLLEDNISGLDGTDCSQVQRPEGTEGGQVSRLMIARINRLQETTVKGEAKSTDVRPKVNYNTARAEEDPFPDPSLLDLIDEDQNEEIKTAVDKLTKTAEENGLPVGNRPQLSKMLSRNLDIFRTSFSSGPPAKLPPLTIDLASNATPVKVRLRNYSQDQRNFLQTFVADLVRHGLAYRNPTSPWACAPLLVPKPGARYRFTVDLRPINKYTVRYQYPMPNVEHELTRLGQAKFFATFDLSHGYWQLPLSEKSQQCQSFITPDGIYTPKRVLHGTTNAVTHLQSALAGIIPSDLRPQLLSWLDDILIHSPTVDGLLKAVTTFFQVCVDFNIKLHPSKCTLFSTEIRWCGRMVSAKGLRYDPRRLDGLLSMEPPTTGDSLQQFVCALQWVKQGIPEFSQMVAPLHDFLEKVYDRTEKRTKRAVSRIALTDLGWGKTKLDAFKACKKELAYQVTLSHRDDKKRLCVYTDASDMVWSGIVTQVPFSDRSSPHRDQRHAPLAFLSGCFNKSQLGWSVLEKEAYAVLTTLARMHWIVATPAGFDLSTDHNNLIFLFDPLSVVPDMSQTSLRKVLRWAVRLSMYSYTCFHIKGDENVWADLLSRWSSLSTTFRRLVRFPELTSSSSDDFDWPSQSEIAATQQEHSSHRPADLKQTDKVWKYPDGQVWIPEPASDLQLRICVIAHTGPGGHRGQKSTETAMRHSFKWSTLKTDAQTFVRACIHCLSTVGGEKVPRPFGLAVHGTKPNDLLQFDYIELGPSQAGDKYVLMLRDDHSDYKWFFAFPSTAAENAATAVIEWCAAFGVPGGLMSDGPTHFKNETVRLVCKGLKVPHHFTLPYSPWSNGAVERLERELLRVMRAILSELRMRPTEWPDLLPFVQSVLNNSPSPQRGGVSPLRSFTGLDPTPPVSTFICTSTSKTVSVTEAQRERSMNVDKLLKLRASLHPIVQSTLVRNGAKAREAAAKGVLPNFAEGDFVLMARSEFAAGEKLVLRCRGPRRVVKALNDYVFQVEDLRTGLTEDIHGTCLKFYKDSSMERDAIMPHVLQSELGMPVTRLMSVEDGLDGLQVRVSWRGLSADEDTFEPLARVNEDVPQMVERLLLRKATPRSLVDKVRAALAL